MKRELGLIFMFLALTVMPVAAQEATPDSGPTIAGCPMFPADNIWNTRVEGLPLDPHSDNYIDAIGRDTGLHPDFGAGLYDGGPIGIPYTVVAGDQPLADITFEYADESEPGPYPIPPDALIEGGWDSTGDRHVLLVNKDQCILFEIYDAHQNEGGGWDAGSGAVWDLRKNDLRPDGWTSADAAGLPILPGLVRYEEVEAGAINHALRFTAEAVRTNHIWPARHTADCGDYAEDDMTVPAYGQRFRLKASFDISSYSPEVQVILTALKTYGMMLADCGSNWYIQGTPDDHWDNDTLVDSLRSITGDNFEAVDTSSLMVDPDSAQAKAS
jgi:hypothetical protein